MDHLIAAALGLIAGIAGTLVAPWVHWGIEKKRKRNERRVQLIQSWRMMINKAGFDRTSVLNSPTWDLLMQELPQAVIDDLRRPLTSIHVTIGGPPIDHDRTVLYREISKIEKKWGLI